MPQHRRPRAPRALALSLATALGIGCLSAQPALAKEDEDEAHALMAPVYTFHSNAILFLTNTGSDAVHALVAIRDLDGTLLGCGDGTLESGEGDVLYVRPRAVAGGTLTVKVYGLEPESSLKEKAEGRDDLDGSLTLVEAASGEPLGVIELLEVPTASKDRRRDIDDCLKVRFGTVAQGAENGRDRNILSSAPPARWGVPRPRPSTDGLAPTEAKKNSPSGKVEDDGRDSKGKKNGKDDDKKDKGDDDDKKKDKDKKDDKDKDNDNDKDEEDD